MRKSRRFRHRAETPLTRLTAAGRRHHRTMLGGVVLTVLAAIALIGPASASSTPPMVLPTGYSVGGLDVSSWQGGSINWPSVAATGNTRFVYAKATEGTYYTNPYFAQQYTGA